MDSAAVSPPASSLPEPVKATATDSAPDVKTPALPPPPPLLTPAMSSALLSTTSETPLNMSTPMRNKAVYPSRRYETKSTWMQCIFGVLYILLVVVCSFLDVVYFLFPLDYIVRPLFGRNIYKRGIKFFEGLVFAMIAGLLEYVAGVKIVVTMEPGDESLEPHDHPFSITDQILLICNHRTEVDWLFFWNLAIRYGCHDRIRVMMKAIIRFAPGVGWALLQLKFPFVNRRWATDEARIRKVINQYQKYSSGSWLAMFPEGTTLEKKTLIKSHEFAMERGEPRWNYVLYPRVRGFELCVEEFNPESILDVTIAYPELADGILPSPLRCIRGQYPKEVHIHMKRYRKATFEAHKGDMDQWLKDRFAEKEELLKNFYENRVFLGKQVICENTRIGYHVIAGCAMHLAVLFFTYFIATAYPLIMLCIYAFVALHSLFFVHTFGK
ncbi:Lysocardiolipin acyltransferase [Globisporangium polare]